MQPAPYVKILHPEWLDSIYAPAWCSFIFLWKFACYNSPPNWWSLSNRKPQL